MITYFLLPASVQQKQEEKSICQSILMQENTVANIVKWNSSQQVIQTHDHMASNIIVINTNTNNHPIAKQQSKSISTETKNIHW